MTKVTSPRIGLLTQQGNIVILDKCQGILNFFFYRMQLKSEDPTCSYVIETKLNLLEFLRQLSKRTILCLEKSSN